MATWSEWFKAAREQDVPLEKYLVINPVRDLVRLYSSGLPVYDMIRIEGKDYEQEKERLKEFSERHERNWVRVYNKDKKGERYSKFALENFETLDSFIQGLNISLVGFDIQLFEWHENKFGGNVLTDERGTCIEIVEGTQDIVGKSLKPFFHGYVNPLGRLCFHEQEVPLEIKVAARKTLNYLKKSRNEFLEGYFEFILSDKGQVYFLDYKISFK